MLNGGHAEKVDEDEDDEDRKEQSRGLVYSRTLGETEDIYHRCSIPLYFPSPGSPLTVNALLNSHLPFHTITVHIHPLVGHRPRTPRLKVPRALNRSLPP